MALADGERGNAGWHEGGMRGSTTASQRINNINYTKGGGQAGRSEC